MQTKEIVSLTINNAAGITETGKGASVFMSCDLEITGMVSQCHITRSSGQKMIDDAAVKFVKNAHYKPAMKNNMPVKEYDRQYAVHFKFEQ